MAALQVSTQVKTVIKRAWHDIEPKLIAWGLTGVTVSGIAGFANDYLHIHISPLQAGLAVSIIGSIAGYLKASTNKAASGLTAQPVPTDEVAPIVVDSSAPIA